MSYNWTKFQNKPWINVGNKIAKSPADSGGSPVWSMKRTGVPITDTHIPCGYWTRNYTPDEGVFAVTAESISGGFNFYLNRQEIRAEIIPAPGLGTLIKKGPGWYQYLWAVGDCMFDTETIEFDVDDGGIITTYQYPYEYTGGTGCCGETIGYTSQQMSPLEEQIITVLSGHEERTYNWALAGGGVLSASTGTSITYTAPATNAGCANNATITLSVDGETCDTLQIATNTYAPTDWAYWVCTDIKCGVFGGVEYCQFFYTYYSCSGVALTSGWNTCHSQWIYGGCNPISKCSEDPNCPTHIGQVVDIRTDAMKLAGCCPEALL